MSERLIIKNFGPIKEVDLELKSMNIFIGDQGTGKSTIVKVLAVCRYFSYIVDFKNHILENRFIQGLKEISIDYLDSISGEINKIWDQLLQIKMENEH